MANIVNETIVEIPAGKVNDPLAQEVYRNLKVLFNTYAGQQALDRNFGIEIAASDIPSEAAKAFLTAEYYRKTQMYEPRARVERVEFNGDRPGGVLASKVVIELV